MTRRAEEAIEGMLVGGGIALWSGAAFLALDWLLGGMLILSSVCRALPRVTALGGVLDTTEPCYA